MTLSPNASIRAAWPKPKLILPLGLMLGLVGGLAAALVSLHLERQAERAAREQWVPPSHAEAAASAAVGGNRP